MSSPGISPWLIRLAVAVVVPTIACFGLYSSEYLDQEASSFIQSVAVLAYPIALIGLLGLGSVFLSPNRSRKRLLVWGLVILVPVLFLMLIRI